MPRSDAPSGDQFDPDKSSCLGIPKLFKLCQMKGRPVHAAKSRSGRKALHPWALFSPLSMGKTADE